MHLVPRLALPCMIVISCAMPLPVAAQEGPSDAERSARAEEAGLSEAFVGITKNGTPNEGLFGIRSTGVSTAPVVPS